MDSEEPSAPAVRQAPEGAGKVHRAIVTIVAGAVLYGCVLAGAARLMGNPLRYG